MIGTVGLGMFKSNAIQFVMDQMLETFHGVSIMELMTLEYFYQFLVSLLFVRISVMEKEMR